MQVSSIEFIYIQATFTSFIIAGIATAINKVILKRKNEREGVLMATKEKEPIFTQMEFNNAQYAREVKQKSETKVQKTKIGLVIAAVAELGWILLYAIPEMPDILAIIALCVGLGGTIAAYIIGGGLGTALQVTWKIAKGIGKFGWICVPFPADIFTGILLTAFAMILIPFSFLFIPLVLVFFNYLQVNKDLKAAEEYLKHSASARE